MAGNLEILRISEKTHIPIVSEAMQLLKEVHPLLDQIQHHLDCLMEVNYGINLLQTVIFKL